ncbi:hypothetical protein BIW11_05987 [Tropilaelaps mercedesae]|uniref:Cuticle protein 10.9-like n=1 Tax=Tropilaelaps mercedesae TaxID=418985 RepID=A0A1V9Y007_9ACAR|nr:hypothetical protein BIW11_05987 [Tropilaelaps mercedesae]
MHVVSRSINHSLTTATTANAPQPYQFGYQSVDEYGTKKYRYEVADAHNNKNGFYSFTDAHGISRHVEYAADKLGFRANIKTNEPGTAPSAPAAALYNAPPLQKKLSLRFLLPRMRMP